MLSSHQISAARRRLRLSAFTILPLLVIGIEQAASAEPTCLRDAPAVSVSTEVNRGRVVGDLSLSKEELTALFSSRHAKAGTARMATAEWSTVGLTESSLEIITSTSTLIRSARGGGYCADLKSVQLKVGYPEIRVYLPKEYKEGSCAYEVVREHEMTHVAITRAVLEDHAPRLERVVRETVRQINPLWAPTPEEAKGLAARVIQTALEGPVIALKEDHGRRNRAIDGEDIYKDLQSLCEQW
jgi:hypothetical protein